MLQGSAHVNEGNPAGQCDQYPQICNRYGTNFPLQNPPLVMQEAKYRYNQGKDDKNLAGTIKFGAFENYGNFNNLRYDAFGAPLGSAFSSGVAAVLKGDWGLGA